jgi:C4-dicarboxylate-binding protein DctP
MEVEAGPSGQKLKDSTESVGIKTLDIWHTGYKTFTANRPLDKPADFKGLKFRVMPSQIQIAQYTLLGAAAVNMDFSETYNALQTGAIDGQENPLDTTYDMKVHEVQKYVTISRHGILDQFIMASKAWFDKLDQPVKDAVMHGVAAGRQVALENTLKAEEKAMAVFKEAGVTIKTLNPQEREEWIKAFAPVREIYITSYGEPAKEMLDLFESEIAKIK